MCHLGVCLNAEVNTNMLVELIILHNMLEIVLKMSSNFIHYVMNIVNGAKVIAHCIALFMGCITFMGIDMGGSVCMI